jgi:hypothetical protein
MLFPIKHNTHACFIHLTTLNLKAILIYHKALSVYVRRSCGSSNFKNKMHSQKHFSCAECKIVMFGVRCIKPQYYFIIIYHSISENKHNQFVAFEIIPFVNNRSLSNTF